MREGGSGVVVIVVGDVAHERVAVVASSLVTWHARGCWGCVAVGGTSWGCGCAVRWAVVDSGGGNSPGDTRFLVCSCSCSRSRSQRCRHRLRIGCRRRVLEVAASVGLMWWRRCGRRRRRWRQWRRGDGHGGGEKERGDVAAFEPALLDLGSGGPQRRLVFVSPVS